MTPTTLEIQQTLECAVGPIQQIERKLCPYSSSYVMEELQVLLADGTTLEMMFKNLSSHALLENARVKPDNLYNPLREIETYRCLLNSSALGTAKFVTSVVQPDRYWLFLERVDGAHLWQCGEMGIWHNAARWLARLHRRPTSMPHLVRYDQAHYAQLWQCAVSTHGKLDSIAGIYHDAVERLLDLPLSFIHGEFYASNILVQGDRICPVDWELAACGPGLIDLAALAAGKWDHRERMDFMTAYRGGAQPDKDFVRAFDCCRLYLSVRLLGWKSGWQPPVAHARDWSGEAFEIAEILA